MERGPTNIAASVHQRLLNAAKREFRPFNELLQRFAIERFIYRLSVSRHAESFILKGALMLPVWGGGMARPTKDIDLSGRIDNDVEAIVAAMKDVCTIEVRPDGMWFDAETVTAVRITEGAEYEGVRARVLGTLGNARVSIQVDTGFGDVIVPGPREILYPVLLDFPPPVMKGYSMESSVAEKFEAMVKLGVLNSRMKDFFDISLLSRSFDFDGVVLAEAIERTFERRRTSVSPSAAVFAISFRNDEGKKAQWRAFVAKSGLDAAPETFAEVVTAVDLFLAPLVKSLAGGTGFRRVWIAPGPWRRAPGVR